MIFFISDTHFDDKKAYIGKRTKMFSDIEDMNQKIIDHWNSSVGKDDIVYHLGDFARVKSDNKDRIKEIFDLLNGEKHLIAGNHDCDIIKGLGWKSVNEYSEIKLSEKKFVLFHYPMMAWHHMRGGSIHLHGHIHQLIIKKSMYKRFHVGCDGSESSYFPIDIDTILRWDADKRLPKYKPNLQFRI